MDSYEVSLKKDIVPAISEKLNRKVDPRKLFTLPIDALDLIFGYLFQEGNVPPSDIIEILNSTDDPNEMLNRLQGAASSVIELPDVYDEREDIIAGIMAGIHQDFVGVDMRNEIEKRLKEIKDIDKLNEYSQMSVRHLQVALGIRPPAEVPPEEQGVVQVAPLSRNIARTAPQPVVIPQPTPSVPFAPTEEPSSVERAAPADYAERARRDASSCLEHRKEEVNKYLKDIKNKMEKSKFDVKDLAPELEVISRVHPDRLNRIVKLLQKAKKSRVKLIFDWCVISQEIEEIDVLVTHWQGIVGGSGAFQAAIPFARFDAMLPDISSKDLQNFISRAREAVFDIKHADTSRYENRIIAIEEIKELAADLMRKALYE